MSFENYIKAEGFDAKKCLNLYDSIPEHRLRIVDALTNNMGWDPEILRNAIEGEVEDGNNVARIGEILTVLAYNKSYSEEVEKNEIPEKIKELINLVK